MITAKKNKIPSILLAWSSLLLAILACNLPRPSGTPQPAIQSGNQSMKTPIPVVSQGSPTCLKGIQPGVTSRADVIKILGEPQDTSSDSGLEILTYPSSNPSISNTIGVKNDLVTLVNEFVEENGSPRWSEIKGQLGEPERTAFSYYLNTSMTYIYASKGQAYVADENMDVVFIKTCFIPMSMDDYMQTLGSTLPLQNPFTK